MVGRAGLKTVGGEFLHASQPVRILVLTEHFTNMPQILLSNRITYRANA